YVRDLESGEYWSAGHQPTCVPADVYEVVFSIDKAVFRRIDNDIETTMEVAVTSERDLEVRRITLHNLDTAPRELELTSYVELSLYHHSADVAHPAFGKLFLETEWLPGSHALICRRRPREASQQ